MVAGMIYSVLNLFSLYENVECTEISVPCSPQAIKEGDEYGRRVKVGYYVAGAGVAAAGGGVVVLRRAEHKNEDSKIRKNKRLY